MRNPDLYVQKYIFQINQYGALSNSNKSHMYMYWARSP